MYYVIIKSQYKSKMEKNNQEQGSQMTQEVFERILSNPEEETPKIAEKLYPNDKKSQEDFINDVDRVIEAISKV